MLRTPGAEPEHLLDILVISNSPVVRAGLTSMLENTVSAVYMRVTELDSSRNLPPARLPEGSDPLGDFDVAVVALSGSEVFGPGTIPEYVSARSVVILTDRTNSVSSAPELLEDAEGWSVVSSDAGVAEISAAVFAASQGLVSVSRDLLPPETNFLSGGEDIGELPVSPGPLTERELEVLALISTGLPNKSIARTLGISEHTVKFHISSIFTRLDVVNRAEAVSVGARLGLLIL